MAILQRSQSRDGARVIWLAVHSTEGKDNPQADDARALRDATWWPSSAHAIADDEPGTLLSGPEDGLPSYDRASWTLRGGNPYSDNIELVATAAFTRAQWLGQPRLLDLCARWLADRHKARPWIPLRHLTVDEVRRRVPGVIGHWDYTRATGDGTHWDPGPNFPWDVVLAKANQYARGGGAAAPSEEDELMAVKDEIIAALHPTVFPQAYRNDPNRGGNGAVAMAAPGHWEPVPSPSHLKLYVARFVCPEPLTVPPNEWYHFQSKALAGAPSLDPQAVVNALLSALPDDDVDPQALADALAPTLARALIAGGLQVTSGDTQDSLVAALRQVLREGVGAESA